MSDKPDPDKTDPEQIKGPGGMNMRELHELVKKATRGTSSVAVRMR